MSPACEALAALFRRHAGQWLPHDVVYQAGRHNSTARLSELRNKHGFKIEQRGAGERSEYRMTHDPFKSVYRTLYCDLCEKSYREPQAIAAQFCPTHGTAMREVQAPVQSDLFTVPA